MPPTQTPPPTLLALDVSYLLFYRINALYAWYKHATGEPPSEEVKASATFGAKLCARLDATIADLLKAHRPQLLLFAYDGHHNWRKERVASYKATRTHDPALLRLFRLGVAHLQSTYTHGAAPSATATGSARAHSPYVLFARTPLISTPPPVLSVGVPKGKGKGTGTGKKRIRVPPPPLPAYLHVFHDALEADDVIHWTTRACNVAASHSSLAIAPTANHSPRVVIIANDYDYYPLLANPAVTVYKLPNKPLPPVKHGASPSEFLWLKILLGDPSDNIRPVFTHKREKLNPAKALALLRQPGALEERLATTDDATRERMASNELLVDNRRIPTVFQTWLGTEIGPVIARFCVL